MNATEPAAPNARRPYRKRSWLDRSLFLAMVGTSQVMLAVAICRAVPVWETVPGVYHLSRGRITLDSPPEVWHALNASVIVAGVSVLALACLAGFEAITRVRSGLPIKRQGDEATRWGCLWAVWMVVVVLGGWGSWFVFPDAIDRWLELRPVGAHP